MSLSVLEKKQKEIEKLRVLTAKMEMELRIDQKLDEIERLKDNIKIQDEALARIEEQINS